MGDRTTSALEYSRALYKGVLDWYASADMKAQVLLGLMGAFVAFLTTSVFIKADDLSAIARCVTGTTWASLAAMAGTLSLAVACGLACLWSRIRLPQDIRDELRRAQSESDKTEPYSPRLIGFFGFIRKLDAERFRRQIQGMTSEDEVDVLAAQIHALSKNVYRKHLFVNLGFVFGGASLLLFLVAGSAYLNRVAVEPCRAVGQSGVEYAGHGAAPPSDTIGRKR